jgi:hypothetical protein
VAALSILWLALAPTVSHALHAAAGELDVEICGLLGSRTAGVAIPDDQGHSPLPLTVHRLGHCPLCTVHDGPSAPPPTALNVVLVSLAFAAPQGDPAAACSLRTRYHALSRGPPAIV